MKTKTQCANCVFAKFILLVMVLIGLGMTFTACGEGSSSVFTEEEDPKDPDEPKNPADTTFYAQNTEDGIADKTVVEAGRSASSVTDFESVLKYVIKEKITTRSASEQDTIIFRAKGKNQHNFSLSGDKVKVSSRSLVVSDFAVSTDNSNATNQGDTCYLVETISKMSMNIITLGEPAKITGVLKNYRYEPFIEKEKAQGQDWNRTKAPYLNFEGLEFVKVSLDSLGKTTDLGQEAFFSFWFEDSRKAILEADKRFEWENKQPETLYNSAAVQAEIVKVEGMFYVPVGDKEPEIVGEEEEQGNLKEKDDNYHTSSSDTYSVYDDGSKVLKQHNEVDIEVSINYDNDPAIIVMEADVFATFSKTPTVNVKKAAKTSRTVENYYIEKQSVSWVYTWTYSGGSISRTVTTVEEYPYIVKATKKVAMPSANWSVTMASSMDAGVDYTHQGKAGKLYTSIANPTGKYHEAVRNKEGKIQIFVPNAEVPTPEQKGWEILEKILKKKDNTYYNTSGDLYKVFEDNSKELDKSINKDFEVSAAADKDGDINVISDISKVGTPTLKEGSGTKKNLTEGSFLVKRLEKDWTLTWASGLTRKLTTVEGEVFYMAGATQLEMLTSTWTVTQKRTVDTGKAYTHNGDKGTLYTETVVWEATYYGEKRTFTVYNKYFVKDATPEPEIVGEEEEQGNLKEKDDNYHTSSSDTYSVYDDGSKVLKQHNEVDIEVSINYDNDPAIIVMEADVFATFSKTPTVNVKKAAKTSRTVENYYIEKQSVSWVYTWTYSGGSISRTVTTVEEYPYIVKATKKVAMPSANWSVTMASSMDAGVDYTHQGKAGKLYTSIANPTGKYHEAVRNKEGKIQIFVPNAEVPTPEQKGWEILEKILKKKDNTYYNTSGDLYKVFEDNSKELDKSINKDFEVSAAADKDGDINVISDISKVGTPTLKEGSGTKKNLTEGSFLVKRLEKDWTLTWASGLTRKLTTVEGEVFYMAGATQLEMLTSTWTVTQKRTVDTGKAYTHNGDKGTLYTETVVWEATYYGEKRTFTVYNKYFVKDATPDPAVITYDKNGDGGYTDLNNGTIKSWLDFIKKTTYNGQTTTKDTTVVRLLPYSFTAISDVIVDQTTDALNLSASPISSSSVNGEFKTFNVGQNLTLSFNSGSKAVSWKGLYTTATISLGGNNYNMPAPTMSIEYVSYSKTGTNSVEKNGSSYSRTTYQVVGRKIFDGKTEVLTFNVHVDVKIQEQENPELGKFLYFYKTYTPTIDNKLVLAEVVAFEKKVFYQVGNESQKSIANPNPSKIYQSVVAQVGGSWNLGTVISNADLWVYTDDANVKTAYNWKKNAALEGVTLKEGDWNQTNSSTWSKTVDANGYTTITVYNPNGSVKYTIK
ncbi:MAG: hypothetical protein PHE89_03240 [Alphaproteobacteria bacterium]|nr:hypothetical protein [Alphaproteobacteria bacterium]